MKPSVENTNPRRWIELSQEEREVVRLKCLKSFGFFCKFAFFQQHNTRFILNAHHRVIIDRLQNVFDGVGKKHTIFNMPPRYGKTEIIVKLFSAWCAAHKYPMEFLHLSYSKPLVLTNSDGVRDIVQATWFMECFGVEMDKDENAKERWSTTSGMVFYATASAGTVTGMGAGKTTDKATGQWRFSGALIIDDPLKPDDAFSDVRRKTVNQRFDNTIKSRLNTNETPIIVVMQRLHEDDYTAMLQEHPEFDFEHIVLPAIQEIDGEEVALWPHKHDLAKLHKMREAEPYTFSSQYQQTPAPLGGGIFKDEYWKLYDVAPVFSYRVIYADTAMKAKTYNDFSVMQCWGVTKDEEMYLIDQVRGKWESPELETQAVAFYNKHRNEHNGNLREFCVEDKASGTGLLQTLKKRHNLPIRGIKADKDKLTRAMDALPHIASGYVYLPRQAIWLSDFMHEHASFTPNDTHKHDDQVDTTVHAIIDVRVHRQGFTKLVGMRPF